MSQTLVDVEVLPWRQWFAGFAKRYKVSKDSADHVAIIGPTGTGKTTLAFAVASLRRYVVALGCKPQDDQLARLARTGGYWSTADGDLPSPGLHPKVLVWPRYYGRHDRPTQQREFVKVFDQAFSAGGWHIVAEEAPHLIRLGFRDVLTEHLTMGRSMASGLILCSQRPRGVPLETFSNAQHILLFGTNDYEDLKRLGGLNGVDSRVVRDTVSRLGRKFDFLHVDTRSGTLQISRYDERS